MKVHAHRADDILTGIRIAKEYQLEITIDHGTEGHLIADEIKASGFPVIVGTDHPVALIQYLPLCAGLAVKSGLPMEEF